MQRYTVMLAVDVFADNVNEAAQKSLHSLKEFMDDYGNLEVTVKDGEVEHKVLMTTGGMEDV